MSTSNVWKKTTSNGLGILFGLPFFTLGCFFFYGGLTTDSINGAPPTTSTRIFFCGFSSIFIVIGFAIMTYFTRIVIDKTAQTVHSKWGFALPLRSTCTDLANIEAVKLSQEVRSSGSGSNKKSTTVYPVRLVTNADAIDINEPTSAVKARNLAEELAKFLTLPMHDATRGDVLIRQADELDHNVAQTLVADNQSIQRPASLAVLYDRTSEAINDDGKTQYHIHFPSITSRHAWTGLAATGVLLVLLAILAWQLQDVSLATKDWGFNLIFDMLKFGVIVPGLLLVLTLRVLRFLLARWEFIINSDNVVVKRRILGIPFSTRLNSNEIELLEVRPAGTGNNGGLFLLTDNKQITVAKGQDVKELEYTRDMIIYAMSRAI